MGEQRPIILVVDDVATVRELIVYKLEKAGYLTIEAESGSEALKTVEAQNIDLIISDIRMPDGDGVELLKKTSESNKNIPFIIISAFVSQIDTQIVKKADAVLQKPFAPEEFTKTVENILKK